MTNLLETLARISDSDERTIGAEIIAVAVSLGGAVLIGAVLIGAVFEAACNENAWGKENAPSCIGSSAALHLLAWPDCAKRFFYRVSIAIG